MSSTSKRKGRENHGLVGHPLYLAWASAKNRCESKTAKQYKDYGGRGIKMDKAWMYNFKMFYDYMIALPHAMEDGYSIDRVNNDGNYEPGNMQWGTRHHQLANRRSKRGLKYIGVYRLQNKYKNKLYRIKYSAIINVYSKVIFIGLYDTEIEAARARDNYIISNGLTEYPLNLQS